MPRAVIANTTIARHDDVTRRAPAFPAHRVGPQVAAPRGASSQYWRAWARIIPPIKQSHGMAVGCRMFLRPRVLWGARAVAPHRTYAAGGGIADNVTHKVVHGAVAGGVDEQIRSHGSPPLARGEHHRFGFGKTE